MKRTYQNLHSLSKLGTVALVALICFIVFIILSFVIAIPIFGKDVFSDLISSSVDYGSGNVALLKYMQLFQSVGLFIVPSFILAILFGDGIGSYLYLNKKPLGLSVVLAVVIVFSANPVINVLGNWNSNMNLPSWLAGVEDWMRQSEDAAQRLTKLFVKADSTGVLLYNVLLIGIIPAIGEELLFRGVIQRVFTEWTKNKHVAIWVTAILFSALHMQFYGFIPRALLGAMFGYLLIWSGNLWLPIIAHFINNASAVIAYYYFEKGDLSIDPDKIGTNSDYGISAIISLLVIAGLFVVYYRYERNKQLEVKL